MFSVNQLFIKIFINLISYLLSFLSEYLIEDSMSHFDLPGDSSSQLLLDGVLISKGSQKSNSLPTTEILVIDD